MLDYAPLYAVYCRLKQGEETMETFTNPDTGTRLKVTSTGQTFTSVMIWTDGETRSRKHKCYDSVERLVIKWRLER